MKRKKTIILLILIIGVASFLRLYQITDLPPGLYPDEAMNGNNALEALATKNFKIFYPENNGREGLFINIQALSIYIFGNEPWALRIVSAIFGILTVLGVYFLTKELFPQNHKIALLAAFLTAVSFWHINFSRIGFRAIMAPFYLTWACYFLLKSISLLKEKFSANFIQTAPKSNKKRIYILTALGGLFYGLGFHSYIAYRATPLLIAIMFIYLIIYLNGERKRLFGIFAVFTAVSIIAFLPLGIYFLNNPSDFFGRTTQVSVFNSASPAYDLGLNVLKTMAMFNFSGDWNWRHNYAGNPELFWPVGIIFLIGVVSGIYTIIKKPDFIKSYSDKFSFLVIFLWLVIASLPIVISNEGIPHALRAIIMIPPVFILAGYGGIWLIEKIKSQISNLKNTNQKLKIFYFLLAAFCLLLIINAYQSYFIEWGGSEHTAGAFNQNYVNIGRELNALPKDLPKYAIVEAGGVNARGIPMPAQTVMFITDTFTPEKQKEKNIFYVLPEQKNQIPENSYAAIIK